MNRVLNRLCDRITDVRSVPDRHLLERFLAARDEAAFAELVRRYGPLVWGACRRRLVNVQDAEDAFQATFLVLVRRANRVNGDAPIGPWLYQVAVMMARNVTRGNRRRGAITGPMEHEVSTPGADRAAERLDLDAALLALPERERSAVVLCHVQGLTRREAAERLGCPEGTLSARLNRALQRLRVRLGARHLAVLAVVGVAVPAGLAPATVRSATIYTTSIQTAAGVSPAVVGLTDGVLRMFWMKKAMTTVVAALVVGAGVLALGTAGRSESTARATEPLAPGAPPAAEEPDAVKRLEKRMADLEKQKQQLDTALENLKAEKRKLDETQKMKVAAGELGSDLDIVVAKGKNASSYTIREVVNEKIGEMHCSDTDVLAKYLARAFNDPKGPKKLRIHADKSFPGDELANVFQACAVAGYKRVLLFENVPLIVSRTYTPAYTTTYSPAYAVEVARPVTRIETREIDLTKYTDPKK